MFKVVILYNVINDAIVGDVCVVVADWLTPLKQF